MSLRYVKLLSRILGCVATLSAWPVFGGDNVPAPTPSAVSANTFRELRAEPQGFLPPIKPLMDIPMRDPHAMLGPDGYYYLVGTQPPDGDTDFWHPYNGIRLFRSSDLKQWENMGYVYTLRDNGTWQTTYQPRDLTSFIPNHDNPKPTIWAPDLYYIKGTLWIAYALAYEVAVAKGIPSDPDTALLWMAQVLTGLEDYRTADFARDRARRGSLPRLSMRMVALAIFRMTMATIACIAGIRSTRYVLPNH